MRIIGVVPGAKLFGSEDLYADQYLFVNGYPKRISACGGTPIGILSSDGYVIERALELCDAFVFCGGARFYPYHFEVMDYAARSGKPVLGICLGMQMMNTYFLVAEEAQRRGWSGTLLALFDQMKKERYMFTEPVDGHWNGHITRDSVDSIPSASSPAAASNTCSAGRRSSARPCTITASPTRPRPCASPAARQTGRSRRSNTAIRCSASSSTPKPTPPATPSSK